MMYDVLQGKTPESLPFASRLDIWYRSNKECGTLPKQYTHASLLDILDDLDVGYNTMIPDFMDTESEEEIYNRGIESVHTLTSSVYKARFHNVKRTVRLESGRLTASYETPHGTLTSVTMLDETQIRQGVTLPVKLKYLIESQKDFKAAQYIFENAEVIPAYDTYRAFVERVGDRGIATAIGNKRESPMRLIQMELMGFEAFTYAMMDYPEELAQLCEPIGRYINRAVEVAADSPADVVTCGAHFDSMITYPPFFREHMLPWLKRHAQLLHSKGKYMACHTDSENSGLLEIYPETGMDIADSICIAPITTQSYGDIRQASKGKYVLYGVIPSTATLANTLSDLEFDRYINRLMQEISDDGARGIILAVSDTTPPGADIERVRAVAKLARQVRPW